MKQFSFKRYGMILRWDLVNMWRKLLNTTLGMALGLFLLENLTMPRPYKNFGDMYPTDMFDVCMTTVVFVIGFYLLFGATTVLADMHTKQERISALMLPGTNLEKFLSRLTRSLVAFFGLTILAFVLADCARMLLALMLHHVATDSLLPYAWKWLCAALPFTGGGIKLSAAMVVMAIWLANLSMATLCGVVFNRNPFVMSALCLFVFVFLFALVVGNMGYDELQCLDKMLDSLTNWGVSLLCLAFAAGVFYLSYRIFCRIQAVNNKFLNL